MNEYPVVPVVIGVVITVGLVRGVMRLARSDDAIGHRILGGLKAAVGGAIFTIAVFAALGGALSAIGTTTGRWRSVPVLSGSMSPTINKGDVAIVVPHAWRDIKVGDVIVFNAPESAGIVIKGDPVIHRVIEVVDRSDLVDTKPNARYLRTKGDNNPDPDRWIVEIDKDVWAQTATVRDVGEAFLLIARPSARAGLLICAAILFAGAAIGELISAKDDDDDSDSDGDGGLVNGPDGGAPENEPAQPEPTPQPVPAPIESIDAYFAHSRTPDLPPAHGTADTDNGPDPWALFDDTEPGEDGIRIVTAQPVQ